MPIFVKIIVIVLVVIILLYLCWLIIRDYYSVNRNTPYIIKDITDATKPMIIPNSRIKESSDARYCI